MMPDDFISENEGLSYTSALIDDKRVGLERVVTQLTLTRVRIPSDRTVQRSSRIPGFGQQDDCCVWPLLWDAQPGGWSPAKNSGTDSEAAQILRKRQPGYRDGLLDGAA